MSAFQCSGEQIHQQVLHAREEERKHVARELHDQIIQALVSVNYSVSEISRACPNSASQLSDLQQRLRYVIDDVRRICGRLRPPVLDSLGLIAAIRSHTCSFERESGLPVRLDIDGDIDSRLPECVEICLYRVVQEALSNIQRHAAASQVTVTITVTEAAVMLAITDDGRGFAVPELLDSLICDRHFGLVGMRERLDSVGGTMGLRAAPGCGTTVRAMVPLAADHVHMERE